MIQRQGKILIEKRSDSADKQKPGGALPGVSSRERALKKAELRSPNRLRSHVSLPARGNRKPPLLAIIVPWAPAALTTLRRLHASAAESAMQ